MRCESGIVIDSVGRSPSLLRSWSTQKARAKRAQDARSAAPRGSGAPVSGAFFASRERSGYSGEPTIHRVRPVAAVGTRSSSWSRVPADSDHSGWSACLAHGCRRLTQTSASPADGGRRSLAAQATPRNGASRAQSFWLGCHEPHGATSVSSRDDQLVIERSSLSH